MSALVTPVCQSRAFSGSSIQEKSISGEQGMSIDEIIFTRPSMVIKAHNYVENNTMLSLKR
jgi:hypothetical protein